ncbi:MAG: DUF2785 domain-containing protein [Spirochaetaceae bacterium]|jgi:RNA binding exosome subunit|nr:DUF2785 domain-containing protein [Spirochaetaceae bacterium]
MTKPEKLKKTLIQIKNNDYLVPADINIKKTYHDMLDHIGFPEYEFREVLIYQTFSNWILKKPQLSKSDLKEILRIGLDENHLFFKIGDTNNNSVHTRTFSILLIPLLLINHREMNFLNKDEVLDIFKKVTRYFIEEKDLRGYLNETGWAHSVAHTADAFDDLALCHEIGYSELKQMLELFQAKICITNYVYIDEEDERIVSAIMSLLSRNIVPHKEICIWIKSFSHMKNSEIIHYKDEMRTNIKNFLRSFYFRILDKNEMKKILLTLKEVLNELNKFL